MNDINYNDKYKFNKKYPAQLLGKIDGQKLFDNLQISRDFIGASLALLGRQALIANNFRKISTSITNFESNKSLKSMKKFASRLYFMGSFLDEYKMNYGKLFNDNVLEEFVDKFEKPCHKNIFFVVKEMVSPFNNTEESPTENMLKMIDNSPKISEKISKYFYENFSAFKDSDVKDNDWSNKLFITSIKTLSALMEVKKSKNSSWAISVFVNEYTSWITEIHKILNKNMLEDDWHELKPLLNQENTTIEWKSTFYTPTEQRFVNDVEEKEKSKEIFLTIVKPMLGMMNTEGGTILVGVVENPEKIVRENIKNNLIIKEDYSLFDVNYELEKKKRDLDSVKRELQDSLFTLTRYTAEKFNGLWEIKALEIKDNFLKTVTVIKITVFKSNEFVYGVERTNHNLLYSLTKRADGRTIEVDLREFLLKENN